MQAPRSLWDSTYFENSWIANSLGQTNPITLIPRLQAAVSQFYPGTKLSFTEYNYGGGDDVSGGIAQVDVLGQIGKNGMAACSWNGGETLIATSQPPQSLPQLRRDRV